MTGKGVDVLTEALGGFDFKRILGIADALPMPLSLIDRDERFVFVNRSRLTHAPSLDALATQRDFGAYLGNLSSS